MRGRFAEIYAVLFYGFPLYKELCICISPINTEQRPGTKVPDLFSHRFLTNCGAEGFFFCIFSNIYIYIIVIVS